MDLLKSIESDPLLAKWLKYGYEYLTGKKCSDIPTIIRALKSNGFSDNRIIKLCNASYTINRLGKAQIIGFA